MSPPTRSASTRPRSGASTSCSPTRSRAPRITGANYDSGEYEKALDAVLDASGYADLRAEQAARRASGDVKQIGIGVSAYVEVTAPVGLHIEWGACEVNADGSATVFAGTSVHGQGHLTAFAMLASDVLGIPMDKITLVNSDTAHVPARRRARSVRARCRPPAARSTSRPKACSIGPSRSPRTCSKRQPTTSWSVTAACRSPACRANAVTWVELAAASQDATKLPDGVEPGPLRHELDFDGTDSTFPFGAHVVRRRGRHRDRRACTMLRHVAVDDCGRILNPLLVAASSTAASPRARRRRCTSR